MDPETPAAPPPPAEIAPGAIVAFTLGDARKRVVVAATVLAVADDKPGELDLEFPHPDEEGPVRVSRVPRAEASTYGYWHVPAEGEYLFGVGKRAPEQPATEEKPSRRRTTAGEAGEAVP